MSIYPLSPRNTPVDGFRGDSNAANSCDSLRILETCTEPGHLANGKAVHNPHVSITYQLQQRPMTLIECACFYSRMFNTLYCVAITSLRMKQNCVLHFI